MKVFNAILATANVPDRNHNVFSEDTLKSMADNKTFFWDVAKKQLIFRGYAYTKSTAPFNIPVTLMEISHRKLT